MAHVVICQYCKKKFDRDKEPFEEVRSRRYAHKECYENYQKSLSKEEKDLIALKDYLKKTFPNLVPQKVNAQILKFKKDYGYTYSGMLKTLIYFYEIKKNNVEKMNGGIGIIPYVYNDAREYYMQLDKIKESNEQKNVKEYVPNIINISINSPKRNPSLRRNLFSFLDEDEV